MLGRVAAEDLSFSHGDCGLLSIVTCTGFLHWLPLLWNTGLRFIKPSVHRKPTPCQSPADGREDPVGIPSKDKAAHHFRKYLWGDSSSETSALGCQGIYRSACKFCKLCRSVLFTSDPLLTKDPLGDGRGLVLRRWKEKTIKTGLI